MKTFVYGRDDPTKIKHWRPGFDKLIGIECKQCGRKPFSRYYNTPWSWGVYGTKLCKKCYKKEYEDKRRPLGFKPTKLLTPQEYRDLDKETAELSSKYKDEIKSYGGIS